MMQNKIAVLIFFLMLMLLGKAFQVLAASDYEVIYTAQLQAMLEGNNKFILIDARPKTEFDEAHITGAINITADNLAGLRETLAQDPKSLVVYANGVQSELGKNMASKAVSLGFAKVMLYAEGFLVWEERGLAIVKGPGYGQEIKTIRLTPQEISKIIESKAQDYVVVDVREPYSYVAGHIPGALNIPVNVLALQSEWLAQEKKIIVYCDTGEKSQIAFGKLQKLGFPHIYQAVLAEWQAAGMPVVAASCH